MQSLQVLMVCSGNICRSPLAELIVAEGLNDVPVFSIASAGTQARDGDPMPNEAQALALRAGLNPSRHGARFLTEGLVSQSSLLLGMSRNHRSAIVRHDPSKLARTFTIREFARLASNLRDDEILDAARDQDNPDSSLLSVLRLLNARKASVLPSWDPAQDDVIDPYRQSEAIYEQSSREISPAAEQVIRVLRLVDAAAKH